jgi:hypothetical protein
MLSGRYDGVERDYFFPRVILRQHGFATRGAVLSVGWLYLTTSCREPKGRRQAVYIPRRY